MLKSLTHPTGPLLVLLLLLLPAISPLRAQTLGAGMAHTVAIRPDGTLWAWGSNYDGQLGDGTMSAQSRPVQISSATSWEAVSTRGDYCLALRRDGTLWAWGRNSSGQLGDGTMSAQSRPVQISSISGWQQVSAGSTHSLAVQRDGTLWAWGRNTEGQLGTGNSGAMSNRSSPVQVGADTNWRSVAAGDVCSLALRTDGTLWFWGANFFSLPGYGPIITTPVQIGTATSWARIAAGQDHFLALRQDGTLWAWGYNQYGQLGTPTFGLYSQPVQVGAASSWASISAGFYHSLALRRDGTLWAWGKNTQGQLGDGSTADNGVPTQVGTASSWLRASGGWAHSVAEQSCGATWTWGYNALSQLGDGSSNNRYTPGQIYGGSPGVQSLSPAGAGPGSTVNVTGSGLSGLTTLTVNGVNALPSVTNSTATSFQFVVPAGVSSLNPISLTSSCGTLQQVLASHPSSALHQLTISPNPAHGRVLVQGAAPGALVELFDLRGRRVARQPAEASGSAQLRLPAELAPGLYLLRCGHQTSRLAVE